MYISVYAFLLDIGPIDLELQCHLRSAFVGPIFFLLKRFFGDFATFFLGIHDLIRSIHVIDEDDMSW